MTVYSVVVIIVLLLLLIIIITRIAITRIIALALLWLLQIRMLMSVLLLEHNSDMNTKIKYEHDYV